VNTIIRTKMKKYTEIILVSLFSISLLTSCKKDSRDYSESVKDKTWWGTMSYNGSKTAYYTVHFNADGSLVWSEVSGDYQGNWAMDGKHLTISVTGILREFKTDISKDDKLENIAMVSAGNYAIVGGELIAHPFLSTLDNTVWNGSYSVGTGIGMTSTMQISFMPGTKLQMKLGGTLLAANIYTRSASGMALRTVYGFFGIVISSTEMKGTDSNVNYYGWDVSK
jgi:hypothetical protein